MSTILASAPLHAGVAGLCLLWAVLILAFGRWRLAWLSALFCLVTAGWAGLVAAAPHEPLWGWAGLAEILRSGVAAALLCVLAARLNGDQGARLARGFGVAAGVLVLVAALSQLAPLGMVSEPAIFARLGLALLVVLIAENIARNADERAGWHGSLPCIALGGLAAFDLLLYAHAALSGGFSASLLNARGALAALAPGLLVLSALRDRRWRRPPAVSREVVFHGATLLLAGAFLLGVGLAGEALRHLGGSWGGAAQAGLLAGAVMALAVALSSRSFRSRIRRRVVDHFFAARYDYRAEWMRCAATLAAPDREAPAPQRALRALADAVDVPGGALLLRPATEAGLRWAGSWNMPETPLELRPPHPLLSMLAMRQRPQPLGPAAPEDLRAAYGPLWLAVPLLHPVEGLLGVALLAPPRAPFPLDEEVEELLLTLGREVALFLAEREAARRLADSRRVAEFARRFAFVAHDVKTVSNQLSLMLANAEAHLDDPEFQRDLLTTMRASLSRIETLIRRLREEEAAHPIPAPAGLALMERLQALAAARATPVVVEADGAGPLPPAAIPAESFDAAVTHLLDNAAEASPPGQPVRVVARARGERLEVDIIDQGSGMSAAFIRDELFRPLATSKPGGSGIGAWQARDLLQRAGGGLEVLSAPGQGTTMRLHLPLAAAPQDVPR